MSPRRSQRCAEKCLLCVATRLTRAFLTSSIALCSIELFQYLCETLRSLSLKSIPPELIRHTQSHLAFLFEADFRLTTFLPFIPVPSAGFAGDVLIVLIPLISLIATGSMAKSAMPADFKSSRIRRLRCIAATFSDIHCSTRCPASSIRESVCNNTSRVSRRC